MISEVAELAVDLASSGLLLQVPMISYFFLPTSLADQGFVNTGVMAALCFAFSEIALPWDLQNLGTKEPACPFGMFKFA